jgi:anti-sigma28 factor (negative regulator of flagellin synthesis)
MNINEVSGGSLPIPQSRAKKAKEEKPADVIKKDRVEVSSEARTLYETEQSKRMAEIQKNIADGFYTRHEVMQRVVDELLKDLA